MDSGKRFSILLVIKAADELESLCNMVKRHFPHFYIVHNEEDAISTIVEHQIDVLLMGLNTIQENEIFLLHLLSAKQGIDKIVFRKMVFCSREDLKDAFTICNKDVFDDYFIVRPLYDPYHLLLRLRFIRRTQHSQSLLKQGEFSVEGLCEYFDQILNCGGAVKDLNEESYRKLVKLISGSMEQMKEAIISQSGIQQQHHASIRSVIDDHTQEHVNQIEAHHQAHSEKLNDTLEPVGQATRLRQSKLLEDESVTFDDSNILLLEDEVEQRDAIKAILDSGGYKAQVSGCATHTMKLLQNWKPDAVLIDLTLPDMSALFVIDQIKHDPDMANTRIMVLAKPGDTQNAQEAMKLGVHEVMLKPIDRDMLLYKMGHNLQQLKTR